METSLSLEEIIADGFVIGAILLCWWFVALIVALPSVALGGSALTDAFRWLAVLLMLTGIGNALVYVIARGIALSEEARFA